MLVFDENKSTCFLPVMPVWKIFLRTGVIFFVFSFTTPKKYFSGFPDRHAGYADPEKFFPIRGFRVMLLLHQGTKLSDHSGRYGPFEYSLYHLGVMTGKTDKWSGEKNYLVWITGKTMIKNAKILWCHDLKDRQTFHINKYRTHLTTQVGN